MLDLVLTLRGKLFKIREKFTLGDEKDSAPSVKKNCYFFGGTKSIPPFEKGLQRKIRHRDSSEPLNAP